MGRFTKRRIKGGESSKLKGVVDRIRKAMISPNYNNHEANLAALKQSLTGSRRHTKDKPSTPHQTAADILIAELEELIKAKITVKKSTDLLTESLTKLRLGDDNHNCDDFTQFFENRADGNCLFDAVAQIYVPIHILDNSDNFQQRVVPISNQLRQFVAYYYKQYDRLRTQPFILPDRITGLGPGPMTRSEYSEYIGRDATFGSDADLAIMAKLLGFSVRAIVNNDPSQNREIDLDPTVPTVPDDYYTLCNNRSETHWVLKRGGKPRDFATDLGRARGLTHPLKSVPSIAEPTTAAQPAEDAVRTSGPKNNFENIRNRLTKKLYRNVKHHNQYIQNRRQTVTTKNNSRELIDKKLKLAKDMNNERFYMDPNIVRAKWQKEKNDVKRKINTIYTGFITEKKKSKEPPKMTEAERNKIFRALKSPLNNLPNPTVSKGKYTKEMVDSIALWDTIQMKRTQDEFQFKEQQEAGLMRPEGWGPDLFDPKDGKLINEGSSSKNVVYLKGQCKKFGDLQSDIAVPPTKKSGTDYGLEPKTTLYGFMVKMFLNPSITIDEMVSFKLIKDTGFIGNDIYEALSTLFVFFGGLSSIGVNIHDYKFLDKLENGPRYKEFIYTTNRDIFEQLEVKATSVNGKSDVTLVHNSLINGTLDTVPPEGTKKMYTMSAKYWAKEDSPTEYDIDKLYIQTTSRGWEGFNSQNNLGMIVFVKNRNEFTLMCIRAKTTDQIEKCQQIYGFDDVKAFLNAKRYELFSHADERNINPVDYFDETYNMLPKPREVNPPKK